MTTEPGTMTARADELSMPVEGDKYMTSPSTSGRFVPDLEHRGQELPRLIENVLSEFGLLAVFLGRPTYQRDDYVLSITSTERPETRDTRIADMLDELAGAEREVGVSSKQEVSP